MPQKLPELSKAEWLLMKIAWKKNKSTARNIFEEALQRKKWDYRTVKTMLDRLVNKGYLYREKLGPVHLYKPKISRSKVTARAMDAFAERVLDNTVAPLLVHLSGKKKLSDEEIASLRKIVEEQGEEEK